MNVDDFGIFVGISGWVLMGRIAKVEDWRTGIRYHLEDAAIVRRYGEDARGNDGGGLGAAARGDLTTQLEPLPAGAIIHEANNPIFVPMVDKARVAYIARIRTFNGSV